jgi:hypothetical protein
MPVKEAPPVTPPAIILLDNNVLQQILGKETAPLLAPILEEAEKANIELAVSDIIIYEALKSRIFKPEKFQPVTKFIDDSLVRYPVDDNVLVKAAQVHEMYGSKKEVKSQRDGIST